MTNKRPIRVAFVCLGNICRSPTAAAVMRHLVKQRGLADQILVDSAGTGDWHVGDPPDERSQETARSRGVPLEGVARQFQPNDFARFDYVLAMDRSNRAELVRLAPDDEARAKVHLLRAFEPGAAADAEVPDPYYGGAHGFDRVFDICEAGCRGLLDYIRRAHGIEE